MLLYIQKQDMKALYYHIFVSRRMYTVYSSCSFHPSRVGKCDSKHIIYDVLYCKIYYNNIIE